MSYKLDPNKNKDPLADLFRQKLENHQLPVDSSSWGEIKRHLGGSNKKMLLWGVFSAISAAVVALLFILSPSEKSPVDHPLQGETTNAIANDVNDKAIAANAHDNEDQKTSSFVDAVDNDNNVAIDVAKELGVNKYNTSNIHPTLTGNKSTMVTTGADEKKPTHDVNIDDIKPSSVVERDVAEIIKEPEQPMLAENKAISEAEEKNENISKQVFRTDLFDLEEEPVAKKKRSWALAAAYTGNTTGNSNTSDVQIPSIVRSDGSSNNAFIEQTALQDDYGEGKHFPELSFSFNVSKQINNRFAIESGVTYTFMHSKFDGAEHLSNYERKQNLHYIGIPVSVTGYILDGSFKWNIYASAGGTIEKGIRMTYKETVKESMGEITNSGGESISGVQLSVNASVGVSYDISNSFSLFLAPRLSYYFDNDQPKSIRTDRDLSFGATLGLKYKL